ncbi:MAG: hypothetical protein LC118_13850 [Dehalococcoidia bacterium]|nr:hypothetical protein [Dehalococcoidia bacterium]
MAAPIERITIQSFSPGIFSDEAFRAQLKGSADQSLGDALQPGAATIDGTYGCVADATGALVPLPARTVQDSSPGVNPAAIAQTFHSDGLAANYLLGAELSGPWGDFYSGVDYAPDNQWDILTTDRAPYETLYTMWAVTVNLDGSPATATHGFYKVRQPRIAARIGTYHTFFFSPEDAWGNGSSSTVSRQFPFGQFVKMRTNVWGKPDYGTKWPVFNAGTFEQTVIALVEGIRVQDADYNAERWDPSVADTYFYLGNGADWFHPAGAFPVCTKPDPNFPWTTDSHMTIIGHYGQKYNGATTAGARLWDGTDPDDTSELVPGGWSAHFRDQSIVSFFKAMPFRVRHAIHHQGRLIMISRRESFTSDEILLYSDWLAPLQYTDDLEDVDRGEFGWDDKFFPPAIDDFPGVGDEWNMGTYDGNALGAAIYQPYYASRPYNLLLPGDDSLGRTCSMGTAANGQLFLIKDQGGAVLVDGDMDNPTVRVAPNVEPTYGIESTGVHTPVGYVYGSRTGVYAWDGGDASRHLSPQLSGFFWEHATAAETGRYLGSRGSFQYWDAKVFAPNDFLFDSAVNSWWRLEPNSADIPSGTKRHPYNRYLIDMAGKLWAFAYKVTADCTDYAFSYSTDKLRSAYSWRSQPLLVSRDHLVSVQDIELVVTPVAGMKIVATLDGYTYDTAPGDASTGTLGMSKTSRTVTFDSTGSSRYDVAIADTQPIRLRADIPDNFIATQVTARLAVSSTTANTPAPKIHQMSFGVGKRSKIPRLGSKAF